MVVVVNFVFFLSSRRRHTRCGRDWSSDVCSSDLDVTLRALVETLSVHLELRGGGFALFAGTRALEVRAGRPGPPQQIAVTYTGPGSTIAALTLTPLDSVLTFGEALRLRVSAKDSSGAPVTAFYVTWSSSDTS